MLGKLESAFRPEIAGRFAVRAERRQCRKRPRNPGAGVGRSRAAWMSGPKSLLRLGFGVTGAGGMAR